MLEDLTALTAGEEILPDLWMDLNAGQLEALSQQVAPASGSGAALAGGGVGVGGAMVEWPSFLLAASKPWPRPTQRELLKTLRRFREADADQSGSLTLDRYKSVKLWWTSEPPTKASVAAAAAAAAEDNNNSAAFNHNNNNSNLNNNNNNSNNGFPSLSFTYRMSIFVFFWLSSNIE